MEKKSVSFKLKEDLTPEIRQDIEDLLARRLKASILKDQTKGNKGRWILKVNKPELITTEALEEVVKKAGANKLLRDISIDGDGD